MSEYIPTTDEVRDAFDHAYWLGLRDESRVGDFDLWLDSIKEESFKAGYMKAYLSNMNGTPSGQ